MTAETPIHFPPFRLDAREQRLYRGGEAISLRPKTYAVLRCLLDRVGQLVTKQQLLDRVWPETAVGDAVLKVSIRELREALGDDPRSPRFIETVHRSGYRFIAEVASSSLPVHLTSFVGRDREIAQIEGLLERTRLLTLTGPGGSGKSRLAARLAAGALGGFTDGIAWVELASLSDSTLVPQTVASTLGVHEQPGRTLTQTLAAQLRARTLLLVLDNCEHLVAACAALADALLRACPGLTVLATSREALAVAGETTWLVPPLTVPEPGAASGIEQLERCEAVRLFLDRARSAQPSFEPDEASAPVLAHVCRRLEGIPLAIELAAPRVKALTLEQLAVRLDDGLALLAAASRTAPPRHRTLEATLDWSYDLLPDRERTVLNRLAVFSGGCDLAGTESVCSDGGIDTPQVLDLLTRLVDKSLVIAAQTPAGARYRLLDTVRHYGLAKLATSGEGPAVHRRHGRHYLHVAEDHAPRINTPERAAWLARLALEHDNLRAALRWAAEAGDTETELRLADALLFFWLHRGHWSEGRGWLRDALERSAAAGGTRLRGRAMSADGMLASIMGDHTAALARLEQSAAIHREIGGRLDLARALRFLAIEAGASDPARGLALAEEGVAIYREVPDPSFDLAMTLANAGLAALFHARHDAARAFFEESASQLRALGDAWGLSTPLRGLATLALRNGEAQAAIAYAKQSLAVQRQLGEKWFSARGLETLAQALAAHGEHERAARLFGAGESLREGVGASIYQVYRYDYDRAVAAVRAALGEEGFAAAWGRGRAMTLPQALASALDEGAAESAV